MRTPPPTLSRCILVVLALLPVLAGAEEQARCFGGISPETAQQVFQQLNVPLSEPNCEFDGVTTQGPRLIATWKKDGAALPPAQVQLRACMEHPPAGTDKFVVEIPEALPAACPSAAQAAARIGSTLLKRPPRVDPVPEYTPLFVGTQILFGVILLLALGLVVREVRRRSLTVGLLGGLSLAFGLAVAVRAALPHVPTNWYSEVLPATGPPLWMRFGPGSFAWQALLRHALPWNERTLYASQVVLGSLSVPLFALALQELRVPWRAAAATTALFAIAPFHALISASSSEHVLASTLTIALLVTWLAALRRNDPSLLLLAMLLIPAAVLTRVDTFIPVLLIPLWSLARARGQWRLYLLYALVAAASGGFAYWVIVRTSNHPPPDQSMVVQAMRDLVLQYWQLATQPPHWIPLIAVAATLLGIPFMLWKRPAQLACALATLVVSFGVMGRTFVHDELVGARYFLFTIPVFLTLAGFGFEGLASILVDRLPRALSLAVTACGLVALASIAAWQSAPAYRTSYAFQDEYLLAHETLAKLPDGCTVYEVPIRNEQLEDDVDCCLDLPRTPLALAFPKLKLRALPATAPDDVEPSGACVAYYESSACWLEDIPELHAHWSKAIDYFHQRCAEVRTNGQLTPVSEGSVSERATNAFFSHRPPVGLYQWVPNR